MFAAYTAGLISGICLSVSIAILVLSRDARRAPIPPSSAASNDTDDGTGTFV